ncbi:PP2C family protein-serine/threonine phosphatase [Streptomyces sp. B1866]|uniref:PP2C family protein-serine/threonine phosphatase n=1 Tax=Streptomyces sp. B1866 TaxID=3075431 RepID=UPI00288C68B5|nr:PP2C family protein-serine/threonine phosphatase [Streptomyces sp. B1866]MDT3399537.1 PP2C family protein-serine/threonine phosphatase [Streptomyces sp. B1866]
MFGFALPCLWVLGVVVWGLACPYQAQLVQLLAAAPAVAYASSGRRQCLLLGAVSALFALVSLVPLDPFDTVGRHEDLGTRLATCATILVVVGGCYLTTGRRQRLVRELEQARRVATAAQEVVLRPLPACLDGLALAGGHLSASRGATVGGDLYEALSTPYGVRVVMGDVRGHGLAAMGTVAAVLGSFREAAHDEPDLGGVLRRLDRALDRHLRERARGAGTGVWGADPEPPVTEDFVTVLLLQIGRDGDVTVLNCGHPWPYRLRGRPPGRGRARQITPGDALPPLGAFPLPADLPVVRAPRLLPGDALVLYTDGAEDARDARGAFFPLGSALAEAAGPGPVVPAAVVERVRAAVLRHTGGRPADDVALLVVRNDRPRARTAPVAPRRAPVPGPVVTIAGAAVERVAGRRAASRPAGRCNRG